MGESMGSHPAVLDRGSGRPLVFLHGYPLHRGMWARQLATLTTRFRLLLVDLPGFGTNSGGPVPDTLAGFASSVGELIDPIVDGPAAIFGHSFGGYIALQMYRDRPDRFSALGLVGTRAEADAPEARERRLETARRLEDPTEHLDVAATTKGLLAPSTLAGGGPVVDATTALVRAAPNRAIVGALRALAGRPDLTSVLPTVDVPTLVVWGTDDQLMPPARTQALAAGISGAIGAPIAGAGHLSPLEAPEAFDRAVVEFFEGPAEASPR